MKTLVESNFKQQIKKKNKIKTNTICDAERIEKNQFCLIARLESYAI